MMGLLISGLWVFAFSVGSQDAAPGVEERARTENAYAVYSVLLSSPIFGAAPGGVYLIQSPVVRVDFPSRACARTPPADAAALAEIRADHDRRHDDVVTLTADFRLNRAFELVSVEDADAFLADALRSTPQVLPPGGVAPPNRNPLAQKATTILRLGGVFFDDSRTRAMVYVGAFQTPYDYQFGWHALKKSANGGWELDRNWQTCGGGSAR